MDQSNLKWTKLDRINLNQPNGANCEDRPKWTVWTEYT